MRLDVSVTQPLFPGWGELTHQQGEKPRGGAGH